MDRSEEFRKVVDIYQSETKPQVVDQLASLVVVPPVSNFVKLAMETFSHIENNFELIKRLERLSGMKEFSNDPTKQVQELSTLFETRLAVIQENIKHLKLDLEKNSETNSVIQHYKLIHQYLSKAQTSQTMNFKNALKMHSKHLEQRQQRLQRYGSTSLSLPTSQSIPSSSSSGASSTTGSKGGGENPKYAMFQGEDGMISTFKSAPLLRQRRGNLTTTHPSSEESTETTHSQPLTPPDTTSPPLPSAPAPGVKTKQLFMLPTQPQSRNTRFRVQQAEKAESSIRQMGQLFHQMTSMIAEQNEVIARIEDDVEVGVANTQQGLAHVQTVYEVTKGNRAMILKIFALLVFFIFLFLVWT